MHANLGITLKRLGRFEDALAQARRSLALARQLGDKHEAAIDARVDIAIALLELGRVDEAQAELETAIAAAGNANEQQVARLEHTLGSVLGDAGRWAEARTHHEKAVGITKGVDAGSRTKYVASLARSSQMMGDKAGAERLFREVLDERTKHLGPMPIR